MKELDEFIRDDVINYLLKKYPLTEGIVVNKALEKIAKSADLSTQLENDFIYQSKLTFTLLPQDNYD